VHSLDLVAAVDGAEPGSQVVSPPGGEHLGEQETEVGDRAGESSVHAERARVNVTRAIRSTLKRITGYDAVLGHELERAVRTGTFCVYEPDPRQPLTWRVEE
jgi:hypothetical protein